MKLRIEIDLDNAAFEDCPGDELANIYEHAASVVRGIPDFHYMIGRDPLTLNAIRDSNGNTVTSTVPTE